MLCRDYEQARSTRPFNRVAIRRVIGMETPRKRAIRGAQRTVREVRVEASAEAVEDRQRLGLARGQMPRRSGRRLAPAVRRRLTVVVHGRSCTADVGIQAPIVQIRELVSMDGRAEFGMPRGLDRSIRSGKEQRMRRHRPHGACRDGRRGVRGARGFPQLLVEQFRETAPSHDTAIGAGGMVLSRSALTGLSRGLAECHSARSAVIGRVAAARHADTAQAVSPVANNTPATAM
jgi:hypothetical protein